MWSISRRAFVVNCFLSRTDALTSRLIALSCAKRADARIWTAVILRLWLSGETRAWSWSKMGPVLGNGVTESSRVCVEISRFTVTVMMVIVVGG